MPNRVAHMFIGAVTGAATNAVMQAGFIAMIPGTKFDWGEFMVCIGAASVAALLPDILEPARSPNHRRFFHSLVMGGLVAYAITGKHARTWPRAVTVLAGALGVGYLSHLAADACTPKSIDFL